MRRYWHTLAVSVGLIALVVGQGAGQDYPIDKGSSLVGAAFAFSSMGGDLYEAHGDRTTVLAATADVSYFASPGIAWGGLLAVTRTSVGSLTSTSLGIGPQVSFFLGAGSRPQVGGATYPFFQVGGLYLRGSSSEMGYYGDETVDFSGSTISLGAGLVHMLSRDVGLSMEVQYDIDRTTLKPEGGSGEYASDGNKITVGAGLVFFRY